MRLPFQVVMCHEANRHVALTRSLWNKIFEPASHLWWFLSPVNSQCFLDFLTLNYFLALKYFLWRSKTLTRQGVSFFWKWNNIFPFKMKLISWTLVQNIDKVLKVSHLLATSLEILVVNTKFLVTLATSWSQFRTLDCSLWLKSFLRITDVNKNIAYLIKVEFRTQLKLGLILPSHCSVSKETNPLSNWGSVLEFLIIQ